MVHWRNPLPALRMYAVCNHSDCDLLRESGDPSNWERICRSTICYFIKYYLVMQDPSTQPTSFYVFFVSAWNLEQLYRLTFWSRHSQEVRKDMKELFKDNNPTNNGSPAANNVNINMNNGNGTVKGKKLMTCSI